MDRTFITSPTKMVLASETRDSNVGGITVVEPATPAINSVQSTDSGTSRRSIKSLLKRGFKNSSVGAGPGVNPVPRFGERRLSDGEGNAGARAAPIDVERAAGGRVLNGDGQHFRGRGG